MNTPIYKKIKYTTINPSWFDFPKKKLTKKNNNKLHQKPCIKKMWQSTPINSIHEKWNKIYKDAALHENKNTWQSTYPNLIYKK